MKNKIIFVGLEGGGRKEREEVRRAVGRGVLLNEKFFGRDNFSFKVVLLSSRQEIDQRLGRKTPNWAVGGFNGKRKEVFILAPWAFEKESCHRASSFSQILIHEIAHLYLYQVYPYSEPKWLTEGVAAYLADQKRPIYSIHPSFFSSGFLRLISPSKKWEKLAEKGAYPLSFYWISFLIDNYGRERLLRFIAGLAQNKKPVEEIFETVFPLALNQAEKEFVTFLKTKKGVMVGGKS